jgi:2-oxoisovalerate dehydrogenase E1 component
MPSGAGVGAGPFHSQTNEAWFFHVPGLKLLYPSTPAEAKGLLLAAFEDPNPVLFFEHKALYRSLSEPVSDDYYTLPIGKARYVTSGTEVSIITYGMGVHWATEICQKMEIEADIIDLRSLSPIDWKTITESVKKTNKALVLHEDNLTGGIGGEIAAHLGEHCFEFLDGPIMRVASIDTPIPFAKPLEEQYLPIDILEKKLNSLLAY